MNRTEVRRLILPSAPQIVACIVLASVTASLALQRIIGLKFLGAANINSSSINILAGNYFSQEIKFNHSILGKTLLLLLAATALLVFVYKVKLMRSSSTKSEVISGIVVYKSQRRSLSFPDKLKQGSLQLVMLAILVVLVYCTLRYGLSLWLSALGQALISGLNAQSITAFAIAGTGLTVNYYTIYMFARLVFAVRR